MNKTQSKRRSKGRAKRELIARSGIVTGWDASAFLRAEGSRTARERKAMLVINVYGNLQEPVRNVRAFKITVFSETEVTPGQAEVPSIGSVISTKPTLDLVITLADREFSLLTAMTSSGRLAHVYMCFQEPRYGSALVASCSFETRVPDE